MDNIEWVQMSEKENKSKQKTQTKSEFTTWNMSKNVDDKEGK